MSPYVLPILGSGVLATILLRRWQELKPGTDAEWIRAVPAVAGASTLVYALGSLVRANTDVASFALAMVWAAFCWALGRRSQGSERTGFFAAAFLAGPVAGVLALDEAWRPWIWLILAIAGAVESFFFGRRLLAAGMVSLFLFAVAWQQRALLDGNPLKIWNEPVQLAVATLAVIFLFATRRGASSFEEDRGGWDILAYVTLVLPALTGLFRSFGFTGANDFIASAIISLLLARALRSVHIRWISWLWFAMGAAAALISDLPVSAPLAAVATLTPVLLGGLAIGWNGRHPTYPRWRGRVAAR